MTNIKPLHEVIEQFLDSNFQGEFTVDLDAKRQREMQADFTKHDNAALQKCCKAALEIYEMDYPGPNVLNVDAIAAIIYKHMRNGREL